MNTLDVISIAIWQSLIVGLIVGFRTTIVALFDRHVSITPFGGMRIVAPPRQSEPGVDDAMLDGTPGDEETDRSAVRPHRHRNPDDLAVRHVDRWVW